MAIETLRPNAAGDETAISTQVPSSDAHWDKVDEVVADDLTTMVQTESTSYQRDLYNLPSSSGSGTINKITVHFRCRMWGADVEHCKASIKSDSTVTDGAEKSFVSNFDFQDFSQEWATNPADSQAWEWADIDALQIGVSLLGGFDPPNLHFYASCTQVYVEVDYTPSAAVPRHAFINFQGPGIF